MFGSFGGMGLRAVIFLAGPAAESASCSLCEEGSLEGLCLGPPIRAERIGDGVVRSVVGSVLVLNAGRVVFEVMFVVGQS